MTAWGPGYEIAGRYRLLDLVGRGGMGEVWRAEHLALHSQVAVKLIDPKAANNEGVLKRFMQEARAAAALESPHVVKTFDFGVVDGTPYIVMELLQGESLAQRLERAHRLSPAETARVMRHVARAVGKAHEAGFVHRDLKPDNVYIVGNDDEELIKVLDFGIAKAIGGRFEDSAAQTRTGALLGTPYYMSPEQAQGDRSVDFRSDLWSMGIIAFECLTGVRPFDSEGLGSLVLKICAGPVPLPSHHAPVPAGFDQWFLRAAAREPAQRFQSARELATALSDVLLAPGLGEASATGAVQWPPPAAQRVSTFNSAVTPVPAQSGAEASTPWNALPRPLSATTNGAGSAEVTVPARRSSAKGWVAVIAVLGALSLGATGLILRGVLARGAAAPLETNVGALPAPSAELSAMPSTDEPPPPPSAAEAPLPSASAGTSPKPEPVSGPARVPPTAKKDAGAAAATPPTTRKGRLGF